MIESTAISLNNLCRERPTHYGVVASEGEGNSLPRGLTVTSWVHVGGRGIPTY
jgi:hypothetical protein